MVGRWIVAAAVCCAAGTVLAQSDKVIDEFHEWFAAHGGIAPKLRLQRFADMGTGIQAVSAIAEDEEVIGVPMDMVMYVG